MSKKPAVSLIRSVYLAIVFLASVAGGWFFGDAVRLAEKPSEYIGVMFSILGASLFAVISIVGDPSMLVSGSARSAWNNAKAIQDELHRFNFLFYVYLITLFLLVASEVAENAKWVSWYWLSNAFTGFAIAGFLLSLAMPADFMALQRRRLQQEINVRAKAQPK